MGFFEALPPAKSLIEQLESLPATAAAMSFLDSIPNPKDMLDEVEMPSAVRGFFNHLSLPSADSSSPSPNTHTSFFSPFFPSSPTVTPSSEITRAAESPSGSGTRLFASFLPADEDTSLLASHDLHHSSKLARRQPTNATDSTAATTTPRDSATIATNTTTTPAANTEDTTTNSSDTNSSDRPPAPHHSSKGRLPRAPNAPAARLPHSPDARTVVDFELEHLRFDDEAQAKRNRVQHYLRSLVACAYIGQSDEFLLFLRTDLVTDER